MGARVMILREDRQDGGPPEPLADLSEIRRSIPPLPRCGEKEVDLLLADATGTASLGLGRIRSAWGRLGR